MADISTELQAVAQLDANATSGTIDLHTSCSWRRLVAAGPAGASRPFLVPTVDTDRHPNLDALENAEFVVALVNFFRAHAAEIEEAVKAAAVYRWLRERAWFVDAAAYIYLERRPWESKPTPDWDEVEAVILAKMAEGTGA